MATVTITKAEARAVIGSSLPLGGFGKGKYSGDLYQRVDDRLVNLRTKEVEYYTALSVVPLVEGDTITLTVASEGKVTGGYTAAAPTSAVNIDTLPVGAAGKGKNSGLLFIHLGGGKALNVAMGEVEWTHFVYVYPLVEGDKYTVEI